MKIPQNLFSEFDLETGSLKGAPLTVRRLSDLQGSFADKEAYGVALKGGDPVIYTVAAMQDAEGERGLHFGIGRIMPGNIGDEYYLTKGHIHSHRPAAEVYIGLKGEGMMLLEDERTGETTMLELKASTTVYVPGHTFHRTVNTGIGPLVYIGVYPANAGHDYGAIAKRNFRKVIVAREGKPLLLPREDFLKQISRS
ncbi:MAG: glucose-6-phosphate isomerase family protein [Bacteroidota bacterium]